VVDSMSGKTDSAVLKPDRDVGVVGYGAYLPRYRLPGTEVARVWKGGEGGTPIREKAVAGLDEDVVTMSIEAARNAVARAGDLDPARIRAVWVGSESHPYAVKPTSTIVAEAIGAAPQTQAGDLEFACKAGTEALQAAAGFVGSGMAEYALAIGTDVAQSRPGDALEYTAASGGAALLVGLAEDSLAVLEGSFSYVSDTPDFWRRPRQPYPSHGGRFTGEPAYFRHVLAAAQSLMEGTDTGPGDYAHVVFHQPNVKFPQTAAKKLGFTPEQVETGLIGNDIGNTYAGSSLIGLTAVLDVAREGDRILLVSYGSGAGSDAFSFRVTKALAKRRTAAPGTRDYIARRAEIDYGVYVRLSGKLLV
jgi:hydroxymethylglutaryl-CoA synthase